MTKLLNRTLLHSFFKMALLAKKQCKFYVLWYHFKSRAKESSLYFCHEIVFLPFLLALS